VVLEPALGEGGPMKAGNGVGAQGPLQGAASDRLLVYKGRRSRTSYKVA